MATTPERGYPVPEGSDPFEPQKWINDLGQAVDADVEAVDVAKAAKATTITAGTGLSGGGDLSADRTLAVSYGTTAGTAAQGNDARLSDQRVPTDNSVTSAKLADGAVTLAKTSGVVALTAPIGVPVNRYVSIGAPERATAVPSEGDLRLFPIVLPAGTLLRIGANITSAGTSGAVVRLGIYNATAAGAPSTLLLDAGTIDGTSATPQQITISQAVSAGLYFLGAVVQGGAGTRPTMTTIGKSPYLASSVISDTVAGVFGAPGMLTRQQASVSGALPASASTGLNTTAELTPLVTVRY